MGRIVRAVDLFCGAGGTSTGLYRACRSMGSQVDLLGINCWKVAIETHQLNHPGSRHICARLEGVRPEDTILSGRLDILVASPECTHHSIARGGKPVCDQLRASAWLVLRWIEALRIDNVLIENVQEFQKWGPTSTNGKPIKSRQGETYQAFLSALRSFGYIIEDRVLNAADYGDPTSRKRLFIMGRKGKKKITWPDPSHGETGLFRELKPYRTAREIIDWTFKGESIFKRKKPLAPSTMNRIAAGLRKFGGANAEPFLVMLYGTNDARSIDRPCPTVTANGNHIGLAEPFIIHTNHKGGNRTHSLKKPLPTVTCGHRGEMALIEPFLVRYHGNHAGKNDAKNRNHSIDNPLPTLDTSNRYALCEPFLVKYFGCGENAKSVDEPLPTLTTKDRFALVETKGKSQIDILFRMLQPHELAAAMSFENYKFAGNRGDQVKQIGNAVPVKIAEALCKSLLTRS
jgi:DNA (cytosine-5)-methyltransferase 1